LDLWNAKAIARFWYECQNGILRNITLQPFGKFCGPNMRPVHQLNSPNHVAALRNGPSIRNSNHNLRIQPATQYQPHLRFQRKPWRKIFEQTAFDKIGISKNTNLFGGICGLRKPSRSKSHTQNRKDQTYSSDHWIPSSGLIAL
jgi:hypothetical protein